MTEDTSEQDLVKALDNVAGAAASNSSSLPTSDAYSLPASDQLPTGAVASPFPTIQPLPAPLPASPSTDIPTPYSDSGSAAAVTPSNSYTPAPATGSDDNGPLAAIKKNALVELRPLVDKLNVSPEEKFDTYLLLIRSTDDTDLIAPAHEAAQQITDEARRAEALLDIIKEIDYLSHPKTDA